MMSETDRVLSERRRREIEDSSAAQGFLTPWGKRITALTWGRCVVELPFSEYVTQQHGFFHGGVIGAIGDTAGGYAAATTMPEGSDVLTLDYTISFLRPATGASLIAEGQVIKPGRTVTVTRVDVFAVASERRTLCAVLQQSVVQAPAKA